MKRTTIISALLLLLYSCSTQQKTDTISDAFQLSSNSMFFDVTPNSTVGGKVPYQIAYAFKGDVKNNTAKIYQKATVTMELFFKLQNGNVLTTKQMNDVPFSDILAHKTLLNCKPREPKNIELSSANFPVEYVEYPVKQVYAQFFINDATDQINNTTENMLIAVYDVTNSWNKVVSTVKANKLGKVF